VGIAITSLVASDAVRIIGCLKTTHKFLGCLESVKLTKTIGEIRFNVIRLAVVVNLLDVYPYFVGAHFRLL
jgi:hypothetical protein